MCVDPITIATVAGIGLSGAGAIMEGQQAQQMADMQAKVYEQQAQNDAQATAFEVQRERRKHELAAASARAQVGASGVALAGSPTEVLVSNARENELEVATIRYGSQLRQNGLYTQADISRYSGQQARSASYIDAAGGFVSGISNLYDPKLYDPKRAVRLGTSPFARTRP